MFGFGVNKRVRELQQQIRELHTRINRSSGAYMELLARVEQIPTAEQTKQNIEELMMEDENLAELMESMSESSKRRFCRELLSFIKTDGYTRDMFHEYMDEPLTHLIPGCIEDSMPDVSDFITDWDAREIASDIAREVAREEIREAMDDSELTEAIEVAAEQARAQILTAEVKSMIRYHVNEWARKLAPTGCSREEATQQLERHGRARCFFNGERMVYQAQTYRGRWEVELTQETYENLVQRVMEGQNPVYA